MSSADKKLKPKFCRPPDDLPEILWRTRTEGEEFSPELSERQWMAMDEYFRLDRDDETYWVDLVIELMSMTFPGVRGRAARGKPGRKPSDYREEIKVGKLWLELKEKYIVAGIEPTLKQ